MYDAEGKYLYEILDDYKDTVNDKEKEEIIKAFMKLIWASKNKRNTYLKDIRFSVSKSLLDTDIGKIFNTYSEISYTAYKSMTKDTDFISLIRQKTNNLYTNLCDGDVCLKKEYMDLIKQPKQMYYRWRSGEECDAATLTSSIENILEKADQVKEKYCKQKMNISWNDYKKLIVPYFKRMFDNFIPLDQFEDKSKFILDTDLWTEDNFAVSYLCKGLDGYMRNYQKEYYGIARGRNMNLVYCECGRRYNKKTNNQKYCPTCQKKIQQEKTNIRVKKYRNKCNVSE
jgi:hypothetical protein